jgi:hypothetical protein
VVIEVRDERGDRALEVDVVLPESVIGVNEQSLSGRLASKGHTTIIRRYWRVSNTTKVAWDR